MNPKNFRDVRKLNPQGSHTSKKRKPRKRSRSCVNLSKHKRALPNNRPISDRKSQLPNPTSRPASNRTSQLSSANKPTSLLPRLKDTTPSSPLFPRKQRRRPAFLHWRAPTPKLASQRVRTSRTKHSAAQTWLHCSPQPPRSPSSAAGPRSGSSSEHSWPRFRLCRPSKCMSATRLTSSAPESAPPSPLGAFGWVSGG